MHPETFSYAQAQHHRIHLVETLVAGRVMTIAFRGLVSLSDLRTVSAYIFL
jgi:hypothetical protein